MANTELQPLPLRTSDFSALRSAGQIYVNKATLIYDFLARPRRFGKSLLCSSFESLFKYGLRNFQGLATEGHGKRKNSFSFFEGTGINKEINGWVRYLC